MKHQEEDRHGCERMTHLVGVETSKVDVSSDSSERASENGEWNTMQIKRVLDHLDDAFVAIDKEWRFVYVNESYLRIVSPLFSSKDQLLGFNLWERFPGFEETEGGEFYKRVMREQQVANREVFYAPLKRWLEVRAYPSPEALTLYIRDISVRKVEEIRSQKHGERMQLLSETLAQLLSARDPNTIVRELFSKVAAHLGADTYFNFMVNNEGDALRLHSSTGVSAEIAKSIEQISFGTAICGTVAQIRESIVANDIQNSDYDKANLVRTFGIQTYACYPLIVGDQLLGTLSFASRTRPAFDEDELEFIRIVAQHIAIAMDRLRTAAELRESERLYRAIGESIDYGVWICDAEGNNIYTSESLLKLIGHTNQQSSEFGWTEVLHPDDVEATVSSWKETSKNGTFWEREHRFKGVDGKWHPILARGVPIRDEQGNIIRWVGINLDIAAYKRTEENLNKKTHSLAVLNSLGSILVGELDPHNVAQAVVDAAREISGATFATFIYPSVDAQGKSDMFRAFSGSPDSAFEHFVIPDYAAFFGEHFAHEKVLRIADVLQNQTLGSIEPHRSIVAACSSMRSYLAVPIVSRGGDVLGGLFLGHPMADTFSEEAATRLSSVADQAAIAIDNAKLYDNIQKSADRLGLALSAAKLGDWYWDAKSDKMQLSDRAREIFGLPVGVHISRTEMRLCLHETDRDRAKVELDRSIWTQSDYDIEYRVNRPAGDLCWVAAKGRGIYSKDGSLRGMLGVLQDITRQKKAEDALREARARVEATLFSAEIGTWTWDMVRDVFVADKNLAQMFSKVSAAMTNVPIRNFMDAVHAEDQRQVGAAIKAAINREGGELEIDFRLAAHDGAQRWVTARGKVERDEKGKPVQFPGVIMDITARRHAEAELKESRDAAEAANLAKDRFLAVLSHELRTPLTPVLLTASELETRPDLSPAIKEDITMIRRNIELEAKLIDDLLDLSRIVSGKLNLRLEPVDLKALIHQVCEICRPQIQEKNLKLELEIKDLSRKVTADPARLHQILWNVVKNAVKFTPHDGTIRVSASQTSQGDVQVQVTDSGIGIEEKVIPRVFDAFEQGDPKITQQFGGLGLGLAITKALVRLHQGSISVSSKGFQQGATFTISIPQNTGLDVPTSSSVAQPTKAPAQLRLLLVEDHHDTAVTLSKLLRRQGFAVNIAGTVDSALKLAAAEPFDILVSDLGLPDGTGFDLMNQIRTLHHKPGIAISGFGMEDDIRKSQDAGFSEHLVKPIRMQQLEQAIRRLAENGKILLR